MFTDGLQLIGDTAESLAGRLAGVSLVLLGIALVLHVAKLAARARAWHHIVRDAYPQGLRYRYSLGAYLAGIGVNAVVPARSGEVVKLALVKRQAPGTKYGGLASTLVTESMFDSVVGAAALAAGLVVGWTAFGGSPPRRSDGSPGVPGRLSRPAWRASPQVSSWPRDARSRKLGGIAAGGGARLCGMRHPVRYLVSSSLAACRARAPSRVDLLLPRRLPPPRDLPGDVARVRGAVRCRPRPTDPERRRDTAGAVVLVLGTGATAASIVRFGRAPSSPPRSSTRPRARRACDDDGLTALAAAARGRARPGAGARAGRRGPASGRC